MTASKPRIFWKVGLGGFAQTRNPKPASDYRSCRGYAWGHGCRPEKKLALKKGAFIDRISVDAIVPAEWIYSAYKKFFWKRFRSCRMDVDSQQKAFLQVL
jgi:hypothetical protein